MRTHIATARNRSGAAGVGSPAPAHVALRNWVGPAGTRARLDLYRSVGRRPVRAEAHERQMRRIAGRQLTAAGSWILALWSEGFGHLGGSAFLVLWPFLAD